MGFNNGHHLDKVMSIEEGHKKGWLGETVVHPAIFLNASC